MTSTGDDQPCMRETTAAWTRGSAGQVVVLFALLIRRFSH